MFCNEWLKMYNIFCHGIKTSIKYILFRIGEYYHSMMPLFRQDRCAPRAPIRCHADFTSRERQHRLAQHDKDPTLALAYFYCCSTDPCVAIFNDELQPDVDSSVIWDCISNLIRSPIGQEEAMLWQENSTTLTNYTQELLPVHLVANAFWVQMVNKELLRWK